MPHEEKEEIQPTPTPEPEKSKDTTDIFENQAHASKGDTFEDQESEEKPDTTSLLSDTTQEAL